MSAVHTQAATYILKEWQPTYHFNEQTAIAIAPAFQVNAQNIKAHIQSLSFQPFKQHNLTLEIGQYYWGKIIIQNQLPDAANYTEWILSMSYSFSKVDIFVEQADGTYLHQLNGIYRPHTQKEYIPQIEGVFTKISLPPNQPIAIYFRGKSERTGILPSFVVTMQHTTTFYENLQKKKNNHAFFIGFTAMMLLYNIILYFFGGDRSFIFYSIYLIALIIYASYNSGDLADWLQPILFANHPEYAYLSKFAIYIGLMAYIAFMRNFLILSQLMPKWDRLFKYLFWVGIPWIIVDFIVTVQSNFSYAAADKVTFIYILLFFITSLVFIFQLFKIGDKKGYFIVAGLVFWFSGILITLIAWGQDAGFSLFFLKTGSVLEIIAFSLGLAYRQRENVKAKEQVHFQLEKSKLVQKQEQAEAQRLKDLDEIKSRLYTNITHEFRTPLTVIMGMNENMHDYPEEQKLIRRNSKNLLRLINQLLDLSKAESVTLKLHKQSGDIVAYLQYLTESFQSMATDKGILLTYYPEEEVLQMLYDEVKIQHIFYNLLSNAIKFTAEGGKVILNLQTEEIDKQDFLKVRVKDTGIGIPEAQKAHIFDRFYQADNSNSRQGEGSGIGLALVKELVQLMQGKIEVNSQVGRGTEFIIYLPIEARQSELTTTPKEAPLPFEMAMNTIIIPSNELKVTAKETSAKDELPLLLIIEDNLDIITYIQSILSKNYTIHTAKNGQLGIDKAISLVPDIIISDVMMPLKDGYEVCETLKTDTHTSHIPIILLTAKTAQDDKVKGLKQGADAFLTKPFHKEELLVRLKKLIAIRQQLQQRYDAGVSIHHQPTTTPEDPLTTAEDIFIQTLQNKIYEHLDNPNLSIPQLAQLMLMERTQLYRKVKALTGKSIVKYLRSIRLQKGADLLRNSDLSVSEITYAIGFKDPSYFARTFHKEFGKSPRDFRKQ